MSAIPIPNLHELRFAYPGWLWLAVLAPWLLVLEALRPRLAWPSLAGFRDRPRLSWSWLASAPALARALVIVALAFALARPRTLGGVIHLAGQGVAIVVVLDHSSSMTARDESMDPGGPPISRLDAARRTLALFVAGRRDDLVGLVAFANYPDLVCPPTLDHETLVGLASLIEPARPGDDGTNIGDAVALGLDALRQAPPHKKVLVLLTDGNNEPAVPNPLDPIEAATLARDLGVTLHAVAIGPYRGRLIGRDPAMPPAPQSPDGPNLPLLERMAEITGGRLFAATNLDALDRIFKSIDTLEKSLVQGRTLTRFEEHYAVFAGLAFLMLGLDLIMSFGRLRRLP